MSLNRIIFGFFCSLFITISLYQNAHAQNIHRDSLNAIIKQEFFSAKNPKQAYKLIEKNKQIIRYDDSLYYDINMHFLAVEDFEPLIEIHKYNPFLMSQYNEQAMYHYLKGVGQMLDQRGWTYFKEAEKSMNKARIQLERSWAADYGFYSDVENARGYLAIVARGMSTDSSGNEMCIVRPDFMYQALDHFRTALMYNPENSIAERNRDTVIVKLERLGLPIPPFAFGEVAGDRNFIQLDSTIRMDSLNDISTMPILDYSLLPNDYTLILQQLHQYDEVMLLIDLSGSMDDPVEWAREASKFHVAHQLALFISMKLRPNVFLGALSVGQQCDTKSMVLNYPIGGVSRKALIQKIANIRPFGWTPLNRRLLMTKDMFTGKNNRKLVFLISDGMDTCKENPDLCGTAAILAANSIDLSVFSFIYETLDPESRSAYSIYTCMVHPSEGKIYKITHDGGLDENIEYEPISNNLLVLPHMDSSILWTNQKLLYQFGIEGVEPPVSEILKVERE